VSGDPCREPHSAAYFDQQRDFWWNPDFLRLVATRLDLGRVRSVLDVGSGLGHWGRTLLAALSPEARVVGVERDPRWVTQAREAADQLGLGDRCSFLQGVAEALPCADQSFDLVSCQTLLIHVVDPAAVIAEMHRVVTPGGTVLLSEPNNLAGMLVADSATADEPVPALVERIEFAVICERGKAAVGEGNSSVGDLLPGLLAQAGLSDIRSMLNDRPFALVPPYDRAEQRALRSAIIDNAGSDHWIWSREDARRYFLAGGGHDPEFEVRWQRRLEETRQEAQELVAGRLHTAGGGIHYLISARRAPT
jgi:ubiquinone/menaquinone biosynthesis C-methylase UbiE